MCIKVISASYSVFVFDSHIVHDAHRVAFTQIDGVRHLFDVVAAGYELDHGARLKRCGRLQLIAPDLELSAVGLSSRGVCLIWRWLGLSFALDIDSRV
jgi:hypothetical protein